MILHPHKLVICTLQVDEAAARNNLLHLLPLKIHRFKETGGDFWCFIPLNFLCPISSPTHGMFFLSSYIQAEYKTFDLNFSI